MGIQINKKPAAPAPEPEAPPAAAPKKGLQLSKKPAKPAPVSEEKVAEVKQGLTAQAKVTTDSITKGKNAQTTSSEATETVTGIPSTASALDHPEALCRVGVEASYTHNLGNYNSTRLGISLSVPCKHDEIEAVYAFTEEWVNQKMGATVESLQAPSE